MLLEIENKATYNLIEENAIKTECGMLYKAMDMEYGRTVAVKMVEIQGQDRREQKANYEKAYSEVKAMVALEGENLPIPCIYCTQYDAKQSKLYIIMQWINGSDLSKHFQDPELSLLKWMSDLCVILDAMDRKHIYHKDIKPSNIMIDNRGQLHLIDFNISISTPNLIEGTLNYKAPEMAQNSKYVGREKVDMFSIGVMLYEYYTGIVPIRGTDYAKNRSRGPFEWDKFIEPKEKKTEINAAVNEIIVKCMKLDPKQRYRNYSDLKRAFDQAIRSIRNEQRRKPR